MDFKQVPIAFWYFLVFIAICIISYNYDLFNLLKSSEGEQALSFLVLVRIFAGFVLAMLFFLILRPRASISNVICKAYDEDKKKDYYTFKFINNSLFPAFDVNIEAYLCTISNATLNDRGVNVKLDKIALTRSKWMYIARWKPIYKNTEYAHHCTTVRTFHEDIDKLIQDNSTYLEFRITLKHAFSNLSSTRRVRYMSDGCIEKGKFKFGNSFKII